MPETWTEAWKREYGERQSIYIKSNLHCPEVTHPCDDQSHPHSAHMRIAVLLIAHLAHLTWDGPPGHLWCTCTNRPCGFLPRPYKMQPWDSVQNVLQEVPINPLTCSDMPSSTWKTQSCLRPTVTTPLLYPLFLCAPLPSYQTWCFTRMLLA